MHLTVVSEISYHYEIRFDHATQHTAFQISSWAGANIGTTSGTTLYLYRLYYMANKSELFYNLLISNGYHTIHY